MPSSYGLTCWGCKKEANEIGPNPVILRKCPTCVKLGLVACFFCSQTCFKEAWPRHKEYHKRSRDAKVAMEAVSATDEEVAKNKVTSKRLGQQLKESKSSAASSTGTPTRNSGNISLQYKKLNFDGHSLLMKLEYAPANRKFRKALKLDPRLPDAYAGLACSSIGSFQTAEAMSYLEQAIDKFAYAALTGKNGDENVGCQWGLEHWAENVFFLIEQLSNYGGGTHQCNKTKWYGQDVLMKKISKVVLEIFQPQYDPNHNQGRRQDDLSGERYKLQKMVDMRANILCGMLQGGIYKVILTPPLETPLEDFEEAIKLMRYAARIEPEESVIEACRKNGGAGILEPAELHAMADQLESVQRQRHYFPTPSLFYIGCLIVVRGLQSVAGQALNQKVGVVRILGDRLGVELEGVEGGTKSIKPQNLKIIPLDDKEIALMSCLSEEARWEILISCQIYTEMYI